MATTTEKKGKAFAAAMPQSPGLNWLDIWNQVLPILLPMLINCFGLAASGAAMRRQGVVFRWYLRDAIHELPQFSGYEKEAFSSFRLVASTVTDDEAEQLVAENS